VDGTAEEHLRIGALEDAGDAGAPLELLLDDRPDGLISSQVVYRRHSKYTTLENRRLSKI